MPWTIADDLRLSIAMGLRKGLALCRGRRREFTEEEQHRVAGAIAEHLKLANWRIEPGPPAEGGSHLGRGPQRDSDQDRS